MENKNETPEARYVVAICKVKLEKKGRKWDVEKSLTLRLVRAHSKKEAIDKAFAAIGHEPGWKTEIYGALPVDAAINEN